MNLNERQTTQAASMHNITRMSPEQQPAMHENAVFQAEQR